MSVNLIFGINEKVANVVNYGQNDLITISENPGRASSFIHFVAELTVCFYLNQKATQDTALKSVRCTVAQINNKAAF